jgi:unsaturated chondroitin disaccharide hydrolase
MLGSLAENYSMADRPGTCKALLGESVYDYPKRIGVEEGSLWGDYFYLEALVRFLRPDWTPYW